MENLQKETASAQLSFGKNWKFQKIVGFCIQKGKRRYREKWVNLEEDRSIFVWKGIAELKKHWSSLKSFERQNQKLIASHERLWLKEAKTQMENERFDRQYLELYLRYEQQSHNCAEDSEYELPLTPRDKRRLEKTKILNKISKKNKKGKRKRVSQKMKKTKGKSNQLKKTIFQKSKIMKQEILQSKNSESDFIDMSNTIELKDLLDKKLIQLNQKDHIQQKLKLNQINRKSPIICSQLNRKQGLIQQAILGNQGSTDLQITKNAPNEGVQVGDDPESENICMKLRHNKKIQLSDSSLIEANNSQQISYAYEDRQLSIENFNELKQIIKKRFLSNLDSNKEDQAKIQPQNQSQQVKREEVSNIGNPFHKEVNESRDSNISLSLQKDAIFGVLQGERLSETFQQYFAEHLILSLERVSHINRISSAYRFKQITFYEIDIGNKYYEDKRFIPSYCLSPLQKVKIEQMRAAMNSSKDQLKQSSH